MPHGATICLNTGPASIFATFIYTEMNRAPQDENFDVLHKGIGWFWKISYFTPKHVDARTRQRA